jgi:hypothetical protein
LFRSSGSGGLVNGFKPPFLRIESVPKLGSILDGVGKVFTYLAGCIGKHIHGPGRSKVIHMGLDFLTLAQIT